MIKKAACYLSRCIESRDRASFYAYHLSFGIDAYPSKREGDSAYTGESSKRRRVQSLSPVGFSRRDTLRASAVLDPRIKGDIRDRAIEFADRPIQSLWVYLQLRRQFRHRGGNHLRGILIIWRQKILSFLVKDLKGDTPWLPQHSPTRFRVEQRFKILSLIKKALTVGVYNDAVRVRSAHRSIVG